MSYLNIQQTPKLDAQLPSAVPPFSWHSVVVKQTPLVLVLDFVVHSLKVDFLYLVITYVFTTIPFKINHPVYNIRMYWTNFWQHTILVQQTYMTTKYFWKKRIIDVCSPFLCAFLLHLLYPNWSIIRGTVSLWRMLEHRH